MTIQLCIFWISNKIHHYVVNNVKKLLHRQKASIKLYIFFVKFIWRHHFILLKLPLLDFHKIKNILKVAGWKISPLFCCVYVSKFPQNLKISTNGMGAICHFLQVRSLCSPISPSQRRKYHLRETATVWIPTPPMAPSTSE